MSRDLHVLLRVLRLFRPYRGWMLLGTLVATLTVLASVALMATAGHFIAAMAVAGLSGVLMNYFLPAAGIRFFAIVRTGGRYAERVITHEATFRLLAELRVWLFERMVPLAPARLAHERAADLVARLQGDVDTLQHAYLRLYAPALTAAACTVAVVALFAWYSLWAALVLLALLLAAGLAVPLVVRRATARPGAAIVATQAALRVRVVDALQGMGDLAVFGGQEIAAREIATLAGTLAAQQRQAGAWGLVADGAVGLCAGLALWLVAVVAMAGVDAGTLAAVEVPMLALAALATFEAVLPLPLAMQRAGEVVAAARRIFALADQAPAIAEGGAPSPVPLDASVVLRDLRLRYPGATHDALRGVDLVVASGRRIAVTGPSGAGKSSIAGVLVRFFDYDGEVRVGGHDLRAYRPEDARRLVGVATQYSHLLNATIRENLQLAAPEASDAALRDALAAVQMAPFVDAAPQGLDTPVGEAGLRLSAGQARRVTLARVLLRPTPVVILDEPTEGLDTHTGRALLAALWQRLAGRTVIVITHDVAQVRGFVDEILTLDGGRVTGTLPAVCLTAWARGGTLGPCAK